MTVESMLKCHSLLTRVKGPLKRKFPVQLCMVIVGRPPTNGCPLQTRSNFTGTTLPSLKVRNGAWQEPPVASAPAMGEKKPSKVIGWTKTLNWQLTVQPL